MKELNMLRRSTVSNRTLSNWIMDAGLFLTALIAILSGIYFLIFPDGGYKGGRNPYYGIQIIFDRDGWTWIHTWIGLGMVLVALIHLIFHWKWVVNTTKRIVRSMDKGKAGGNRGSWLNTLVNSTLALAFLVCSITGVYLLIVPGSKCGLNVDPMILFSRTVWELLHTWSGILFVSAALTHFVIHWGWVTKVTRKIFRKQELVTLQPVVIESN